MTYVPHALLLGILLSVLSGYGAYQKGKESATDKAEVTRLSDEVVALELSIKRQNQAYFDAQEILNEMWAENAEVRVITKTVIKEVPIHVTPEKDVACSVSPELMELLNSSRGYYAETGQRAVTAPRPATETGAGDD